MLLVLSTAAGADTLLGPDDFESGFGSWSNVGGDLFDWTRLSGPTGSSSTGPDADHTSGSGFYLYTEASSPRLEDDDAILESPCIDLSSATDASLEFWYHMFGAAMGSLDVEVAASAGASCASLGSFGSVFTQSGDLGNVWNQANVVLDSFVGGSVVIRFVGLRGSSHTGDMAIDDVLVSATLSQSCSVPADCDDLNPCTDDACNASVCEYTDNSASCDDGNACTSGDMCSAGVCQPGAQSCGPIADYVIVLSVDGVNSDMLKAQVDLDDGVTDEVEVRNVNDSGDYHNWKRLATEGVYTWNSRADYDATITTPNHTSMATSYPVGGNPGSGACDVIAQGGDTDDHCYTNNGEPQSSWTLHAQGNPDIGYFPSMYDIAHDRGFSTSYFASKTKFIIFDQSYDATNGAPDTTGPDDGNDKIDRYYEANVNRHFNSNLDDALEMHLQFMWEMFGIDNFSFHIDPDVSLSGTPAQRFNLTTLHYVDPDKSGHSTGWPSADYYETLRQVDDYLGDVMNAIEADPILDGRTTLIVVTDHGGGNPFTHHSTHTDIVNYKIPMFVWGAGAEAGAEFYSLNTTTRTDPGTSRPNFDRNDLSGQPIRSSDTGNLALSLMSLPPIPGSIVNSLQDLSIGAAATCGDSVIDAGEDCDDGNTLPGDCCSASCQFELVGSECRASAGSCDVAETCSGSSGSCPVDGFETGGTECRASAGSCDVAEQCTGASAACPADGLVAGGTECRASSDVCDVAEQCTGATASCPADGFAGGGTLCRGSAGACDAIEQCTGAGPACPSDSFVSGGVECRAAADVCDSAEQCTGSGPSCPADGFVSGGTECRGSAGLCDAAEQCTGSGASCPADGFIPGGTECRAAADVCDAAEQCTGSGASCPADGFVAGGTECRASAGLCDVAEQCTGAAVACPADGFASAGAECRASVGSCDAAETCTGAGAACPGDAFELPGTECRPVGGACDVAEQCSGSSATCPGDGFIASGTECRAAAGVCDLAEQCSGAGPACPADGYSSGTLCRGSTGACDAIEVCAGFGPDCPSDGFVGAGVECRGAAGVCDVAEQCTGGDPDCPADGFAASSTVCDDGVVCTQGDICDGFGSCTAGTPDHVQCDDGAFCNGAELCITLVGCQTGPPPPGDGVGCTDDVCDEVGDLMVSTPNDTNCDNGLWCDGDETCDPVQDCQAGSAPPLVPDGNPCTDASCDEANDRIEQVPENAHCQNGDVCDGEEFCNPIFGCEPSPVAFSCDDGDACTADSCDAITGCAYAPVPGCEPLPAASPGGRALLSLLLVAVGATLLSRRGRAV